MPWSPVNGLVLLALLCMLQMQLSVSIKWAPCAYRSCQVECVGGAERCIIEIPVLEWPLNKLIAHCIA